MVSKVFVNLTNLKLPQLSQAYLKIFVWLQHLIKIHQEYYENNFEVFFIPINKHFSHHKKHTVVIRGDKSARLFCRATNLV